MENDGVSSQSVALWVIVGTIVGILACNVVKASRFGWIGDVSAGIVGALVGGLLLSKIGFEIGLGFDPIVIDALLGSLVLLTLFRVVTRTNRQG
ncbi:MAG: GlsB/YeaQ/YmgE family stress response membrane protein [Xanthobacteraceae bacterium]